jgi:hypothetical protein
MSTKGSPQTRHLHNHVLCCGREQGAVIRAGQNLRVRGPRTSTDESTVTHVRGLWSVDCNQRADARPWSVVRGLAPCSRQNSPWLAVRGPRNSYHGQLRSMTLPVRNVAQSMSPN